MNYFWNKNNNSDDEEYCYIDLGADVEAVEMPVISETKSNEWVDFGEDNLFPKELQELYLTNPMNQSIINRKALMMGGSGVDFDKSGLVNPSFMKLIKFADGKSDLESLIKRWSLDYQFGSFAIEVMWSRDFSKITKIKYVDASKVRSGWMTNGEVNEYFYSDGHLST